MSINKIFRYGIMLFVSLLLSLLLYPFLKKHFIDNNEITSNSWIIINNPDSIVWFNSWNILTNSWFLNIPPGINSNTKIFEDFRRMAKEHSRYFYPDNQPTTLPVWSSYTDRSNLLNDYLKNNIKNLNISWDLKKWYLFIKLSKPITNKIFMYWYWDKLSWYLDINKSLEYISDKAFIFDLNNIPLIKYWTNTSISYKWLDQLNKWYSEYIGWYVTTFDWSSISEIIITWE